MNTTTYEYNDFWWLAGNHGSVLPFLLESSYSDPGGMDVLMACEYNPNQEPSIRAVLDSQRLLQLSYDASTVTITLSKVC